MVKKATPTITWATPAAITYGTALSGTQLDATASVPGTFTYTPAAGTVLSAGTQTLSVTFTPTDTTDYNAAPPTVQLLVAGHPDVTWPTPGAITYGTALSGTQLDATASVAGTFVYPRPPARPRRRTQTLSVTFTPTDTTDYNTATKTVQLVVNTATPTVTWTTPAAITYGTALSATQLNASANVTGTFVYSPAAGTVLGAGTQTFSVTFTPTDTIDYNAVPKTVPLVVNKATPIVTWNNLGAITTARRSAARSSTPTPLCWGPFLYNRRRERYSAPVRRLYPGHSRRPTRPTITTATQTAQLLINNTNLTNGTSVFVLSPTAAGP